MQKLGVSPATPKKVAHAALWLASDAYTTWSIGASQTGGKKRSEFGDPPEQRVFDVTQNHRALPRRDITVPAGQPKTLPISW